MLFMQRASLAVLLAVSFCVRVTAQDDTGTGQKPEGPLTVGILMFEGVELLDFAGPAEVFIVSGYGRHFRVVTIASSKSPLKTMGGIKVVPDHKYDDAPKLDILVVPGGAMSNVEPAGVKWLKDTAPKTRITMSVCMGAFLMAEASLLDGIEATTHRWGLRRLGSAAPKCRVISDRRFVDSGRIITTGGVTAGIDGALHIVERIYGKDAAEWTADEWMEYRIKRKSPEPADADQSEPSRP